jgi:signal transduction histidine kinase
MSERATESTVVSAAEPRAKILLVDDSPGNLVALEAALECLGQEVVSASSGFEALRCVLDTDFAAIILDVKMPEIDGFETAALIRARKRSEHTPILFLTGYHDEAHLHRGYALGAVDFLFKPVLPDVLRSKVSVFVELRKREQQLERQAREIGELNSRLEIEVERRTAQLKRAIEDAHAARAAADFASQAKSRFLANMSHELRTPLNAVIGYAELLEEEADEKGLHESLPDIKKIRSAAGYLLDLINRVLDLSRIEAGKMEVSLGVFNLETLVREAANTAWPLIRRNNNALDLNIAADCGSIFSDAIKIRQCLLNLLSNAARFTRNGRVQVDAHRAGDAVLIRVTDSGVGMSADQIEKLFQPFTQVHSTGQFGGTGLGLAITRRLCRLLGGEISVRSQPGRGSRFEITLPVAAQRPSPQESDVVMPSAALAATAAIPGD